MNNNGIPASTTQDGRPALGGSRRTRTEKNRIEENEKTRASRPGFFMPRIRQAGSKAVLLILVVERYLPNSRYRSGTLSSRFNPALDVSSMLLDNVTSCESTSRFELGKRV